MDDKTLGRLGETLAAQYLTARGYRLVCRNFRTALGEIDLIAHEDDTIVFVEVKTRLSARHGRPSEAVSYHKQRKIIRMAHVYLSRINGWHQPCRFDVIEILWHETNPVLNHIRHAFVVS